MGCHPQFHKVSAYAQMSLYPETHKCNSVFILSFSLQIYNYQGVVNEDYNIANTPAPPNGKFLKYVLTVMFVFPMDKFDLCVYECDN